MRVYYPEFLSLRCTNTLSSEYGIDHSAENSKDVGEYIPKESA